MPSDWEAVQLLIGEWEGGHEGDSGQGQGNFSFSYALNQNILARRSRTAVPETLESDPAPSAPHLRLTYIKTRDDTMTARFEIAPPGQPGFYNVYLDETARHVD